MVSRVISFTVGFCIFFPVISGYLEGVVIEFIENC
jgi:hypothetical protein